MIPSSRCRGDTLPQCRRLASSLLKFSTLNVSGEKFVVIYLIYHLTIYNLPFAFVLQMLCQTQLIKDKDIKKDGEGLEVFCGTICVAGRFGGFFYRLVVTAEGIKGSKEAYTSGHGHLRMLLRNVVRQIDDIVVGVGHRAYYLAFTSLRPLWM
jgi:hypothetical protein